MRPFGSVRPRVSKSEPAPKSRLQRWLTAPGFDRYVDASRAALLNTIVLGLSAVLLLALGLNLTKPQVRLDLVLPIFAGLFAIHGGTLWLLRRKQLFAAALTYSAFAWMMATVLTGLLGGLTGQHASSFVVVVLVAGFCLGGRWALGFSMLSVVSAGVLVFAEMRELLPLPLAALGPVDQWQSLTVSLLMAATIVHVALNSLDDAVRVARDRDRAYRESVEELRELERQSEARARHGGAIGMLGQELIRAPSAAHFYSYATRVTAETMGIDIVVVFDRQGRTQKLHPLQAFGVASLPAVVQTMSLHPSVQAVLDGERSWAILVRALSETRGLPGEDEAGVGLLMPVPGRTGPRGLLWAASKESRSFPDADRLFLETVAGVVARAMDREQSEAELRQAQKMEAVGRLAGGVAHDFNNLLTGILGGAELLILDLPADSKQSQLVRDISQAANRAALLTQRILTFSRKQLVKPAVMDLNQVVKEFEQMLRRIIGEHVKLLLALGPGPLWVHADRGNLEQVMLNLVVNARDALPTQGGEIMLCTGRRKLKQSHEALGLGTGRYIWFSVQDTGHGMDEVTQSRVFEPFFTTKEEGKGTGLGLSTVRRILRESRGEIAVESAVAKGTTFTAFLPEANESEKVHSLPPVSAPTALVGEVVLLVEDHEIVRKTATAILNHAGYRVVVVPGPREAQERLAALERVDLVLSDVVMPEMSGYELRAWIEEAGYRAPVLLMSGYSEEALEQPVVENESCFIRKPFTPDALLKKVREVIDSREHSR